MSAANPHIIVVGGGVIGLMTARALRERGACRVTVLERQQVGQESSWAGGGIVSPLYPWRYSPPVTALARQAQAAYPALAVALHDQTGIDPEFHVCGMLMLDTEDSRDAQVWAQEQRLPLERIDTSGLRQRFPFVTPVSREGLWMPLQANIRNPRLMQALRAAVAQTADVAVVEHAEVCALNMQGGRCTGVQLADGGRVQADAVVVCSGAWTGRVLESVGIRLPVRPIQGQMIAYQTRPGDLPHMVMRHGRYLIPRRDGLVLCGSTLEDVGFAKATSAEALADLKTTAGSLWPALTGLQPVAHWAGLRPASPNGIPFIGPVPDCAGLWVNAGQFRNGLVLAPASADLLADLFWGLPTRVSPAPYAVLP